MFSQAAPVRDKVKRRSLLDALPRTFEEWSTYDASDEVRTDLFLMASIFLVMSICVVVVL